MGLFDLSMFSSIKDAVHLARGKDVTVVDRQVVHGGDANESYRLILSDGGSLFLKANSISNADFFRAEAEGIAAIKSTKAVRVPDIYAVGTDGGYSFLLMEYIERAYYVPDFWENLGICLANMHMADASAFVPGGKYGFQSDNYIGAGAQKNTPKSTAD